MRQLVAARLKLRRLEGAAADRGLSHGLFSPRTSGPDSHPHKSTHPVTFRWVHYHPTTLVFRLPQTFEERRHNHSQVFLSGDSSFPTDNNHRRWAGTARMANPRMTRPAPPAFMPVTSTCRKKWSMARLSGIPCAGYRTRFDTMGTWEPKKVWKGPFLVILFYLTSNFRGTAGTALGITLIDRPGPAQDL